MSQRRPLIAGNWKMNLDPEAGIALAAALRAGLKEAPADVVVAPTYLALTGVIQTLAGSAIGVAGQNCHAQESGAFTGEISAAMLRSAGAGWVILGHSERRQLFGETDTGVNEKARVALDVGLAPILCFGEVLEQREAGRAFDVVLGQVEGVLAGLSPPELGRVTLAYEPVWAIGTGKTASDAQAQEMHASIRAHLAQRLGPEIAEAMRILYGGSVKPDNVAGLMCQADVDGVLVGGASLKAESFLALVPPYPPS